MKKSILSLIVVALAFLSIDANAQEFPEVDKSVLDMAYYPPRAAFRNFEKTEEAKKANMPIMRVIYSRPLKKGRDVFPELVKFGEVWRLGANESTELTVFTPVTFGDTKLEAGRYTMYAVPGEKEWEIHISSDTDNWGAYAFDPAESTVAKMKVPVSSPESTIEAFSVKFEKADDNTAHMLMGWDDQMVKVPFGI